MATVKIVLPEELDEVDQSSIVAAEVTDTNAVFRNRGGDDVGDFVVRNPSDSMSPAIIRLGVDAAAKDVLIKDWYSPVRPNQIREPGTDIPSGSAVTKLSWSPTGKYLAVARNGGQQVAVYRNNKAASWGVPCSVSNFVSSPPVLHDIVWSPKEDHFLVAYESGSNSFYRMWRLTSPDAFSWVGWTTGFDADIQDSDYPTASWSSQMSDGKSYLACLAQVTDPAKTALKWWSYASNAWTRLSDPIGLLTDKRDLAWSPSGDMLLVVGGPNQISYKRVGTTLQQITPFDNYFLHAERVEWSPDGRYVTVGRDGSPAVAIYRREFDRLVRTTTYSVPSGNFRDFAWSPDSRYLAVMTKSPHAVLLLRYDDGALFLQRTMTAVDTPDRAAWDPTGDYLATAGSSAGQRLRLYLSAFEGVPGIPTRLN